MRFNLVVSVLFATALTLGAVLAQAAERSGSDFNVQTLVSSAAQKTVSP